MTNTEETSTRKLAKIVDARPVVEGGGLRVNRAFPIPGAAWFDPFLLLDEMEPTHHEPGKSAGVPPHPHRGFETVTYVFEGEIEHKDSAGNHDVIRAGDIQWMTAGDGIVHSEMTSERIQTEGGTNHGLQLWVNLPAELRRTPPKYQAITRDQIPTVTADGWEAHLVAGELLGQTGPAETHTPVTHAMLNVEPGATVTIDVEEGQTALIYVVDQAIEVGGLDVLAQQLAVFEKTGGGISFTAKTSNTDTIRCLFLAGQPIDEPMERYGPFVMNTKAELQEAIEDFNAGRMGQIAASGGTTRMHDRLDN